LETHIHIIDFSIDQQLLSVTLCEELAHLSIRRCFKLMVSWTYVLCIQDCLTSQPMPN